MSSRVVAILCLGGSSVACSGKYESAPSTAATLGTCVPSAWQVTASRSTKNERPQNVVDGLPDTGWSTGARQAAGEYLQVDFGGWVTVSRALFDNRAGRAGDYLRGFQLMASKDGVTFPQLLASGTEPVRPEGGVQVIEFEANPLRALRVESTEAAASWWSINELSLDCQGGDDGTRPLDPLLCEPNTSSAPPPRSDWRATASSTGDLDSAQAAFDRDWTTRWSCGAEQAGGEWLEIDLGRASCIGSLWFASLGDEVADTYSVEVSADGARYVQVAVGGGSALTELHFRRRFARFVRINQVGSGGANWWSVQELEVE